MYLQLGDGCPSSGKEAVIQPGDAYFYVPVQFTQRKWSSQPVSCDSPGQQAVCAKNNPNVKNIQKHCCLLRIKGCLKWTEAKGKKLSDQTNLHLKFLVETTNLFQEIQAVISKHLKSLFLWWYGDPLVCNTSGKVPSEQKSTYRLKPNTGSTAAAWLCSGKVQGLNRSARSPDSSPIVNICCIMKSKLYVGSLSSQNSAASAGLISSWMFTDCGKHGPVPTLWGLPIKLQITFYFFLKSSTFF